MVRKRQRSRAAPTEEDDVVTPIDESESTQDRSEDVDIEEEEEEDQVLPPEPEEQEEDEDEASEALTDERKREQEVWDAFKEEHHEVLEQLPLSLHRQFELMRELDGHSEAFHADILESVRRYIHLRKSLVMRHVQNGSSNPSGVNGGDTSAMQVDGEPPTKPGDTTRKLLQHIAKASEEAIRTAEEKVNIAQTAYETVDRHIRLLDQAIKEQEAAISLGVRPGTHLAPIMLPDLIVPRWARPPRVEHSPVPSLSPEPDLHAEEPPPLDPPLLPKPPRRGKKVTPPKPPKSEETNTPEGEELSAVRTRRTGVRLTIPAQAPPPAPDPTDPSERRYCYCNQVSFGTMIGCDNNDCKLEWFHLECTGLVDVPSKKATWYCRACKPNFTYKGRSRA